MKARAPLLASGGAVAIVVVVLVLLGLRGEPTQVLAIRVPDSEVVTTLAPGATACEGPLDGATGPIQGARVWGAAVSRPTVLDAYVRSPAGRIVASGRALVGVVGGEQGVPLAPPVAARDAASICVRNAGPAPFVLLGSPSNPAVKATLGTKPTALQFSLALVGPPRSTFSQLQLAFSRAALFRPGWVGAWTFWVLFGGFLIAAALAAFAVVSAARSDD